MEVGRRRFRRRKSGGSCLRVLSEDSGSGAGICSSGGSQWLNWLGRISERGVCNLCRDKVGSRFRGWIAAHVRLDDALDAFYGLHEE